MPRKIVLIVLDSVGIGELPDAHLFSDSGSNTLQHVLDINPSLRLPNLEQLGLGHLVGSSNISPIFSPLGSFGKMATKSLAKDTITGHWEMMGLPLPMPFKTYPKGFPEHLIDELSRRTNKQIIGNEVASGTERIERLGREQMATKGLIVYTSADSVMQIAAHESIIPIDELYQACEVARELMQGEYLVARIIARPFTGKWPFVRTSNRHDFSVKPTGTTALDLIVADGLSVIGIGKICDIFSRQGISQCLRAKNNAEGMALVTEVYRNSPSGLVFANLVDFDAVFGHRNNAHGFGMALAEFDSWLGGFLPVVKKGDCLIIVADHGCDPTFPGTDHTREYVPLLFFSPQVASNNLGVSDTLADVGATILDLFHIKHHHLPGNSFATKIGG
ncbi:MAG: phosphopentomutase [bacterium]|nr:phosphopentomutase [bacterium]